MRASLFVDGFDGMKIRKIRARWTSVDLSVGYQIASVNSIISSATDDRERINQSTSFSESLNRSIW